MIDRYHVDPADAYFILQRDPDPDTDYAISTLNLLLGQNGLFEKAGRTDLVNEDYGPDLNDLAERLGIHHEGHT
jgi:hypothetical protein